MSELDRLRVILEKTRNMRDAQRGYFRTREAGWLGRARSAELEVDRLIGAHDKASADAAQGLSLPPELIRELAHSLQGLLFVHPADRKRYENRGEQALRAYHEATGDPFGHIMNESQSPTPQIVDHAAPFFVVERGGEYVSGFDGEGGVTWTKSPFCAAHFQHRITVDEIASTEEGAFALLVPNG
ncbi:MAG: hypothetical protein HOW73_17125 [Polyangiaceae bacterium]|nr:hypothetical protein [Polyangiaceae bacterium]